MTVVIGIQIDASEFEILDKNPMDFILRNILDTVYEEGEKMFEETHKDFSPPNQPRSVRTNRRGARSRTIKFGRSGEIYSLVSLGSPEHEYGPKNAKLMVFQTGYRTATQPGVLQSRSSQTFGPRVTAEFVRHPGFEGRKFDETVTRELANWIVTGKPSAWHS